MGCIRCQGLGGASLNAIVAPLNDIYANKRPEPSVQSRHKKKIGRKPDAQKRSTNSIARDCGSYKQN